MCSPGSVLGRPHWALEGQVEGRGGLGDPCHLPGFSAASPPVLRSCVPAGSCPEPSPNIWHSLTCLTLPGGGWAGCLAAHRALRSLQGLAVFAHSPLVTCMLLFLGYVRVSLSSWQEALQILSLTLEPKVCQDWSTLP